jgi:dTDP-glucose 4,6-dehydratase
VAGAILFLVENGVIGEKYNIVGEREVDNLEMAQSIANFMHTELKYEMVNFHETRPGHDVRYSLAGEKLARLGWSPPVDFDNSLRKTVEWTLMHPEWLE